MTFKVISMSDVQRHKHFESIRGNKGDDFAVRAILHDMGMDMAKAFSGQKVKHRSDITDKIVTCVQYSGQERLDADWVLIRRKVKSMERFDHPYSWEMFS